MSDHLIAEANRHAKTLPKMTLPTTKANDRDLAWYIAECIDLKKQLEMECAAKREHMRIACAEINELKVRARVLEQENAALRNEIARLNNQTNWVCKCGGTDCEGQRENAALREALASAENGLRHGLMMEPVDPFQRGKVISWALDTVRAALKKEAQP